MQKSLYFLPLLLCLILDNLVEKLLYDPIKWMEWLDENEIGFKSLQESIDTRTSTGKLIFHIFGALSEFEKNLIYERSRAGLEAARVRGRQGGRPKKLNQKNTNSL